MPYRRMDKCVQIEIKNKNNSNILFDHNYCHRFAAIDNFLQQCSDSEKQIIM